MTDAYILDTSFLSRLDEAPPGLLCDTGCVYVTDSAISELRRWKEIRSKEQNRLDAMKTERSGIDEYSPRHADMVAQLEGLANPGLLAGIILAAEESTIIFNDSGDGSYQKLIQCLDRDALELFGLDVRVLGNWAYISRSLAGNPMDRANLLPARDIVVTYERLLDFDLRKKRDALDTRIFELESRMCPMEKALSFLGVLEKQNILSPQLPDVYCRIAGLTAKRIIYEVCMGNTGLLDAYDHQNIALLAIERYKSMLSELGLDLAAIPSEREMRQTIDSVAKEWIAMYREDSYSAPEGFLRRFAPSVTDCDLETVYAAMNMIDADQVYILTQDRDLRQLAEYSKALMALRCQSSPKIIIGSITGAGMHYSEVL